MPENDAHYACLALWDTNFIIIWHMQTFTQSFLIKVDKFNYRGRHMKTTDFSAQK